MSMPLAYEQLYDQSINVTYFAVGKGAWGISGDAS